MFEAASQGASLAAGAVANIVANLIAFLSLLAFIDGALSWLGGMLDCPQLSFSVMSYDLTLELSNIYSLKIYSKINLHKCTHSFLLSVSPLAHLLLRVHASFLHDGCFLAGQFHRC